MKKTKKTIAEVLAEVGTCPDTLDQELHALNLTKAIFLLAQAIAGLAEAVAQEDEQEE
jgi:hypothetical protein